MLFPQQATARGATWMSSGGGAIELALDCEDAWNVRLEMEDARGAAREMRCENAWRHDGFLPSISYIEDNHLPRQAREPHKEI